ncbi:hypothetical protein ACFQYP_07875 [Nonomuraea antimicrobica]
MDGLFHGVRADVSHERRTGEDGGQPPEQRDDVAIGPVPRAAVGDVVDGEEDHTQSSEIDDLFPPRVRERGRGQQATEGQPTGSAVTVGEQGGIGTQKPHRLGDGVKCGLQHVGTVSLGHAGQLVRLRKETVGQVIVDAEIWGD